MTKARHGPYSEPAESSSLHRSILMLSSHLRLGLTSGLPCSLLGVCEFFNVFTRKCVIVDFVLVFELEFSRKSNSICLAALSVLEKELLVFREIPAPTSESH